MSRHVFAACFYAAAILSAGCGSEATPATGSVSGTILNETTHTPVSGISLRLLNTAVKPSPSASDYAAMNAALQSATVATVTTDSVGHYGIADVPNGEYALVAGAPRGETLTPTAGQDVSALSVHGESVVVDFVQAVSTTGPANGTFSVDVHFRNMPVGVGDVAIWRRIWWTFWPAFYPEGYAPWYLPPGVPSPDFHYDWKSTEGLSDYHLRFAATYGWTAAAITVDNAFYFAFQNGLATPMIYLPIGSTPESAVYEYDYNTQVVKPIDPPTTVTADPLTQFPAMFVRGLAVDKDGNAYVTGDTDKYYEGHHVDATIQKFSPGGVKSVLAGKAPSGTVDGRGYADGMGTAAQFREASGIAVDGSGNVYVADTGNNAIRKITPAGVVTTLAGQGGAAAGCANGAGTEARFNSPTGIAVDKAGNVFVADTGSYTIRKITPEGVVSIFAGACADSSAPPTIQDGTGPSAGFAKTVVMTIDGSSNLYVAEGAVNEGGSIRKITPGGVVTTVLSREYAIIGLAVDGSGNLYFSSLGREIKMLTASGSIQVWSDPPAKSTFPEETRMAIDPTSGNLLANTNSTWWRVAKAP